MKKFLLFLSFFVLAACAKHTPDPQTATLSVAGMTCESCVEAITGSLTATPGVTGCQVSLTESNAVVSFDATLITPEQLVQRVDGLGYHASLAP